MSDSREDDCLLPKSTVEKMIQNYLEKGITIGKDAKEAIMLCCVEFIHLVSSESNEICEKEKKKTIAHEHLLRALKNLGYDEYVKECQGAHDKYMQISKMKPSKKNKLKTSGLSMDQLHIEQMKLFEKAKMAYEAKSVNENIENLHDFKFKPDTNRVSVLNGEFSGLVMGDFSSKIPKFNNEEDFIGSCSDEE
ncbi:Negative cofactor 2 complex subunit beta [Dictyocoela muelleri]|nr:Negative cofactor 2 complex subunit beta [Dictyocoela muelleri]